MNIFRTTDATSPRDFKTLRVTSTAFDENGWIPASCTCDGEDRNPALQLEGLPDHAESLAIIVTDRDAPRGPFCHWAIWNIPLTHFINENEHRGTAGMNDFGRHRYNGPCPPSGTHQYEFKVYALSNTLSIPVSSNSAHLEAAMADHILGFGCLAGKYKRNKIIDTHRL